MGIILDLIGFIINIFEENPIIGIAIFLFIGAFITALLSQSVFAVVLLSIGIALVLAQVVTSSRG